MADPQRRNELLFFKQEAFSDHKMGNRLAFRIGDDLLDVEAWSRQPNFEIKTLVFMYGLCEFDQIPFLCLAHHRASFLILLHASRWVYPSIASASSINE